MRRLVALLVSLLLLLPAGSVSAQAFFCNMRGSVMSKCCCGEKSAAGLDAERSPQGPVASQGACCDELTLAGSAERRSISANDDLPQLPPAVMLAELPLVIHADVPALRDERAPARARAPPSAKPAPFYILHRAFLS
ncbi:MAG: hypothetical protein IT377_05645 [Polyangiaceae bacterium]|nr:hypothetical protein [Polyangiaceae bacterium]